METHRPYGWDGENVLIPEGIDTDMVIEKIIDALYEDHVEDRYIPKNPVDEYINIYLERILNKFDSVELQGPNYVLRHLRKHLHDPLLSRLVSDEIIAQAKGRDLSQRTLYMIIVVKLTQKEYLVVPAPSTDQETCAICLETMSESKTSPISQLPNCGHLFHEQCLNKWLGQQQNSCPLCRQAVDNLREV
ncbi:unnamed protein product [Arabis nemorensis]|uniref:RING-type domain-containing protein n=1 Tax=Arabis nemorensis TaxID=586526 RepID=A0A565CQC9_9BRAS|nr:unnamed protein product [Arabis nemorensis]